MKVICLIPARGGSKGIPGKNIKELNQQPLISYSILDSLRSKLIEETYVSTDSVKIANVARKYGAEVPFMRPKKYATDKSQDVDYIKHFISWYSTEKDYYPNLIVGLRPTTPIREVDTIDRAISSILEHPDATSLRSVELFEESPYKWFDINGGYLVPLLNDDKTMHMKPRQQVPKAYRPNGYIDIYLSKVINNGDLCGDKMIPFITPQSIEIDNKRDFAIAQFLLQVQ